MATRSAGIPPAHIEALNLVEIEFLPGREKDRRVLDAWKLYRAHLTAHNYPPEAWPVRRVELFTDLLYEMSVALGHRYDKAQIAASSYYPQGYEVAERDALEMRNLLLEVLRRTRAVPVTIHVAEQRGSQGAAPHTATEQAGTDEPTGPASPLSRA